jgi:hypothetical protein
MQKEKRSFERFQGVERIVLMALARGVARIERSEIRGRRRGGVSPGFATLNPGYIIHP